MNAYKVNDEIILAYSELDAIYLAHNEGKPVFIATATEYLSNEKKYQ